MSDTVKNTVSATRAQLEQTLDAIDDKFDVKKRSAEVAQRSTEAAKRAQASYESNPVPWIIGATAAAIVVVGLVAWAIFSDD
jgi:ElaB/YqjD/DUF883 family membrane-anchored ribosome-binding protein